MKNYISVDDRFFRVTLVNGKPVLDEVKADEAISYEVEAIMITEDENAGIDRSMFQDIIDNANRDMKQALEQSLKSLVLEALGLRQNGRDGTYFVSGFNDEGSPVVDHIAKQLQARIKEIDFIKELDLTPGEKTKLRAAMKKRFKDHYERTMMEAAWREGEKLAKQHTQEIVKELMGTKLKDVAEGLLKQAIREKSEPNRRW